MIGEITSTESQGLYTPFGEYFQEALNLSIDEIQENLDENNRLLREADWENDKTIVQPELKKAILENAVDFFSKEAMTE